ncbi:MAG: right-handed parallel beta-helix repeat-containing protein [Planctomycetaceae bacterium]|nr:right-handed parallel beta-helix repeat-containing protein [Planctomycetaceae bacterium]
MTDRKQLEAVGTRRGFLRTSAAIAGLAAPALFSQKLLAGPGPAITNPRATDGDNLHEPQWDEKLTLTVGTKQGDLQGNSDRPIQAAIDYVNRLGGGTIKILPGTYTFRNSVFLPSGVRLLGGGPETILTKIASETINLADDSDWYDQEIRLEKSAGFRVGDGVVLKTKNPHNGNIDVIKRTLVARSGNRFKLNDGIRKNLWISGSPTCSSLFPLLTSERTEDVVIENLTLDGNRKNNTNLNGNHGGAIFLQDCNRFTFKKVEARHYNGDGFSFQICHDVIVEDCYSHDNADLGVHPGSGSQRPILRDNRIENNGIGIFWCWGVKFGLAEGNTIRGNRNYGISIGHNDTDNIMRDNHISDSGKVGILFRNDARGNNFWANRNLIENNVIQNSGGKDGIAIDLQGKTTDVQILNNKIQETRASEKRIGIRIAAEAGEIKLAKNKLTGFAQSISDLRTS